MDRFGYATPMIDIAPLYSTSTDTSRPLVLVVEGDEQTSTMLSATLTRVGYEVCIAADGKTALRLIEEQPNPHAVLLDWMLPEMNGLEVCRRIREHHDALSLPILMITAQADAASVSAAFEAGASDYLTKPLVGAEVKARLASHLRIKQLSDERRSVDEHFMEREKLSTLGLLVSSVAHDLNNPLAGIFGYAQFLVEEESDPERLVALEHILAEAQRCNRIVANLLSFGRQHTPVRSEIDIGGVLSRTLALRERPLQDNGIWPCLSLDPELPPILGDEHQLQQVFVNILINAEHALRYRGSTLSIAVKHLVEDDAESLAIHFYNDGPPIPDYALPRIFDPFFTTKAEDEGTGLGLAISQRIVREHGGDIYVETGAEGTTFTLLFPIDHPRIGA